MYNAPPTQQKQKIPSLQIFLNCRSSIIILFLSFCCLDRMQNITSLQGWKKFHPYTFHSIYTLILLHFLFFLHISHNSPNSRIWLHHAVLCGIFTEYRFYCFYRFYSSISTAHWNLLSFLVLLFVLLGLLVLLLLTFYNIFT